MNPLSFTVQDIIGTILAFLLFPLVMVTPGYVVAGSSTCFISKAVCLLCG